MSITAIVHTKNEEAHIDACLKSLAWADEVIVADMASTDRTRAIASAYKARILDMPLAPMVEAVRNLAIEQSASEWVLIVDADERIPSSLAKALIQLARDPSANAYEIPIKLFFLGVWIKHGSWPDYHLRFFRKGVVKWPDAIHQLPQASGEHRFLPADPDLAIEHYAVTDLPRYLTKLANYSGLDAERLANTQKLNAWPWIIRRPVGEFYGRFFREQSWRHGMHGLVWSLVMSAYQLQVAMNYWALQRSQMNNMDPRSLRWRVRWEAIRSNLKWLRF